MIVVKKRDFVSYNNLNFPDKHAVFYPGFYTEKIMEHTVENLTIKTLTCLAVGLNMVTGKYYRLYNSLGSISCIFINTGRIKLSKRDTDKTIFVKGNTGDVAILGSAFRQEWSFKQDDSVILLYEQNYLPSIYLNIQSRIKYGNIVKDLVNSVKNLPEWQQCAEKHFSLGKMLGKGSYGNVYKTEINGDKFAVKLSKLKPEALEETFSNYVTSWHEVYFLREIIKPILEQSICPNLPLIYEVLTCKNCSLNIDNERIVSPCVTSIVELASGDLDMYFMRYKPTVRDLQSALFQIMAALHAIQMNGQIMNYDVKKKNILFYDVEPGGYWRYEIRGKNYYVPNCGKLFVLNDFGISRSMSPNFPLYKTKNDLTFRLGSRYAVIIDGEFVPLETDDEYDSDLTRVEPDKLVWKKDGKKFASNGSQFRMEKDTGNVLPVEFKLDERVKSFLQKNNLEENTKSFFLKPELIPPFEFYNDTQDAIRMFIGGKRTTQKGYHGRPKIIKESFVKSLRAFDGVGESMKKHIFSTDPSQVLAGYFIEKYFTFYEKKKKDIIESFIMS